MSLGVALQFSLLVALSATAGYSLSQLERRPFSPQVAAEAEVLYLPDGRALDVIGFGYRNVLANILWFNTVSYFGKHFRGDRNYQWLYHMSDLVTSLDPEAKHVYRFGATMLAWEGNDVARSLDLLNKAIVHHPGDWLFYYLRGFTHMFFLKDPHRAKEDLVTASKLPNVHPVIVELAAKKVSELETKETAIRFLRGLISGTEDTSAREALLGRLKELEMGAPQ